jgi:hypothetical protein
MNKNAVTLATSIAFFAVQSSIAKAEMGDRVEAYEISKQAYIYAFPMIAGYKAMNEFNIDKTNSQYKGPFNTIISAANVFTPKDTAIVTPKQRYAVLDATGGFASRANGVLCTGNRQEPVLFSAAY